MRVDDLTFAAADLAESDAKVAPIAFVDLARESGDFPEIRLPPCPVVGIGARDHALAARLDAVLEPRFDAAQLALAAKAQPLAAAVVTQTLRVIPALAIEDALNVESLAYATLQGSESHRCWLARRGGGAGGGEGMVLLDRADTELTVTLNRPEAGNAIDRPMRDALHEAFALVNMDTTIRRVVLRAEGKAFSLGAELSEFGTTTDPAEAHHIRGLTLPAREAALCRDRLEARIDGACIGAGLELAAFAARIVATPRSWFQLPELAMGILPGAGGCVSLSRRIGRQRTLLMVLSGRRLGAREALDWGLVDAVVDELP